MRLGLTAGSQMIRDLAAESGEPYFMSLEPWDGIQELSFGSREPEAGIRNLIIIESLEPHARSKEPGNKLRARSRKPEARTQELGPGEVWRQEPRA